MIYRIPPLVYTYMAPTRAQLIATSDKFIQAYNEWTIDSVMSVRSSRCIHRTLPASRARRPKTNAEFAQFLEPLLSVYRGFKLSVIDVEETVIDVEKRKVVLHLRSYADTDAGPYENEYFFILTMSEDGEMVDEVVEYLDSGYTDDFMRRLSQVSGAK
jgi:ketosteroid isomerase-like protein